MDKREKERSERNVNPTKLFSGMMGAMAKGFAVIDFLGITDEDPKKKEKKKSKSGSMESESMNMNESFLKQSNVLKKILSKSLQEGKDVDLLIKLEICDILDQYLDQKMDFCLNIFKNKFKDYIDKLDIIDKLQ